MPFTKLNLAPNFLRGVQAMGYTEPTPIQLRAIPVVLSGRDLVASAQTASRRSSLGPGQTRGLLRRHLGGVVRFYGGESARVLPGAWRLLREP